jgi:hypothetical protein
MSGGGSSSIPKFKATGNPPSFDYQSALGLNQLAIGGDVQGYTLSDQDFANRYPALQDAYNQWQANLGTQTGQVAQGQATQQQLMQGLAGNILGRQGTPTTSDINNIRNAGATAAGAVQPIYNLGTSQAGLAGPLIGMGQQQQQIGQGITGMGGQLARSAQIPYQLGQQLLQEPIDPMTQQQMMRAGLGSAAGSLGAASLGQGMAGQAAAARQLGLNTLQYGQAMRGEAMGDINQYASMLGSAGQMKGLGASTIGAGGQTIGLGGSQLAQGAQTYGLGANTAATAGGLAGQAQGAQEQYQMDTAQMAQLYGGLQGQQQTNLLGNIANAGQMFQKRPFGLGGASLAQSELGQANAYNSFNQSNFATMNGIAWNQAQLGAQQAQLNAANQSSMISTGVGVGTAAATTGATVAAMTCWVARAVYPDNRWKAFRHWMLNRAPAWFRRSYLRHGEAFSVHVRRHYALRLSVRFLMDRVIERTCYVQLAVA